ncbi:MAG: hypothetical protein CR982_06710 [Candidatus Cloacimonadota bacterium]|nr:MAG: hypothetical protein CR982_06710 [Candidatus Cloacimonadota bacterium]PIE77826.1 MAG: hypothetical protein CSA15_11055 [Candidatus Delongbacteria bacterium]
MNKKIVSILKKYSKNSILSLNHKGYLFSEKILGKDVKIDFFNNEKVGISGKSSIIKGDIFKSSIDDKTYNTLIVFNYLRTLKLTKRVELFEYLEKITSSEGVVIVCEYFKGNLTPKQNNFIEFNNLLSSIKEEYFPFMGKQSIENLLNNSFFENKKHLIIDSPDSFEENDIKNTIVKKLKNKIIPSLKDQKIIERANNLLEKIETVGIEESPMILSILKSKKRKEVYKLKGDSNTNPRERLLLGDLESLKLSDLVAIIIGMGTKAEDVFTLSRRIIKEYGSIALSEERSPHKIMEILNIGEVNACKLVASFELGRRFFSEKYKNRPLVRGPEDVFKHVESMKDLIKENFRGLYLNSKNYIIHDEIISIGHLTASLVHPREVFRPAVEHSAAGVIVVHNHPSGVAKPSKNDDAVTDNLKEAGKLLGIPILDHIIVGNDKYYSYNSEGKI